MLRTTKTLLGILIFFTGCIIVILLVLLYLRKCSEISFWGGVFSGLVLAIIPAYFQGMQEKKAHKIHTIKVARACHHKCLEYEKNASFDLENAIESAYNDHLAFLQTRPFDEIDNALIRCFVEYLCTKNVKKLKKDLSNLSS